MSTVVPLIVFVLQIVAIVCFWRFIARPHLRMTYVYPLFAVRDKLIYLLATGKLGEDDFLYQEIYKATNIIIQNSQELTLRRFVEAVVDAKNKGYDPSDERLERIIRELERLDDRQVNDAIVSFYKAVIDIFIWNSIVLRLVTIKWRMFNPDSGWLRFPKITSLQKTAWEIFNAYQRAWSTMSSAA